MQKDPVPLNDLMRRTAFFQKEFLAITSAFFESGRYVLGTGVEEFERQFAAYCGVEHCIGVGNGTDALEIALKSTGVEPGDKVALCANAAMYGTTAVLACGATPVFIDTLSTTATMSPEHLKERASASGPLKAILVTHLYGRLADIDVICEFAKQVGAAVVEDCAQAHGATKSNGSRAGSFGDAASFSFYPTKNLGTYGDGGAITTRNPQVAGKAIRLRQYGWATKYYNVMSGGRNSRLDELQARYLLAMLPFLDDWNQKRRSIAARYRQEITHMDISVPDAAGEDNVAHLCIVRSKKRDALRQHLTAHGIQTDIHYPIPDHRQPCHLGRFDDVKLPTTERDSATVLTLPCFPELTDIEINQVIQACNAF